MQPTVLPGPVCLETGPYQPQARWGSTAVGVPPIPSCRAGMKYGEQKCKNMKEPKRLRGVIGSITTAAECTMIPQTDHVQSTTCLNQLVVVRSIV